MSKIKYIPVLFYKDRIKDWDNKIQTPQKQINFIVDEYDGEVLNKTDKNNNNEVHNNDEGTLSRDEACKEYYNQKQKLINEDY